ncbi:hypothetical protein FIM08_02655 [SAR202 cluster bacterium AC-647-N09_OGT_505m]|nr:hypothetical protein [SAR202 cluster bacterium AC-647-N09_OGT_505m]
MKKKSIPLLLLLTALTLLPIGCFGDQSVVPTSKVTAAIEEAEIEVGVIVEVLVSEEAIAMDTSGSELAIVADQEIELQIGMGSTPDTIVIPVHLGTMYALKSFEDSASGVTLIMDEIEGIQKGILVIPLADMTTGTTSAFIEVTVGEVSGTGKGSAEANVDEIVLKTAEQSVDLSAEAPDLGTVAAYIEVNLIEIHQDSSLHVTIEKEASPEVQTNFELAAADVGTSIVDVAYTINITKTNLSNVTDIGEARITMKVAQMWVDAQGGTANTRIFRSGDDGTRQVLDTIVIGQVDGNIIFEGASPDGLSVFGLVALSTKLPSSVASTPMPATTLTPTIVPTTTATPRPTLTLKPSSVPTPTASSNSRPVQIPPTPAATPKTTPMPTPTVVPTPIPVQSPTPVPSPMSPTTSTPTQIPPTPTPTQIPPTPTPTQIPPTPTPTSVPNTASVTVKNFAFVPMTVSVGVGETATWNFAQGIHTTTGIGSESWSSGNKSSGSFSHTFNTAGTFHYMCNLHSSMTGTVIVY